MDVGDRTVGAFVAASRGVGALNSGDSADGRVAPTFNVHSFGDIAMSSGVMAASATMIYMFYWIGSLWAAATGEESGAGLQESLRKREESGPGIKFRP
jgi:hypothetical protein